MGDSSEKTKKHSKETDAPVVKKNHEDEATEAKRIEIKGDEEGDSIGKAGQKPSAEIYAEQEGESLKQELESVKQKAEEEHDRLLRIAAEFENYKKRMQRQEEEYRKYANEALIKELLTVVDNLERAVCCSGEGVKGEGEDACILEGVEMTLNEILKILKKFHVTEIQAIGKPFDPSLHMAIMQEDSEDFPENTVISEFQKGYMIHNRLLRPAMVVVSKREKSPKQGGEIKTGR